ncbi:TIGR03085 family metal-binding protein [Kutzneria viridogrisea]
MLCFRSNVTDTATCDAVAMTALSYRRYMGVASEERRLICEVFEDLGPDAPTLCEGWSARDLAAHLVVRERRLDAAPGILIPALAAHTQRVQDEFATKPWPKLVDLIRSGPPTLSVFGIPGVDELANATEYFVHHEDLRRAQPGWTAREPEPRREAALWGALSRTARMSFRNSPVGIVLRRPNGEHIVAKKAPTPVTLTGEPSELLLLAFGRDQATVDYAGDATAVNRVRGLDLGL